MRSGTHQLRQHVEDPFLATLGNIKAHKTICRSRHAENIPWREHKMALKGAQRQLRRIDPIWELRPYEHPRIGPGPERAPQSLELLDGVGHGSRQTRSQRVKVSPVTSVGQQAMRHLGREIVGAKTGCERKVGQAGNPLWPRDNEPTAQSCCKRLRETA